MDQQTARVSVAPDPSSTQTKDSGVKATAVKDGIERVRRLRSRNGVSGDQRHEDYSTLNRVFGLVEPEVRPYFHCSDREIESALERRFDEMNQ